MPPSVVWGVGAGALIAAIDTLAVVAIGRFGSNAELVQTIDLVANVVLYTLIGLRVGRATGVVRDAAEGGVLAALLVAGIGVVVSMMLGPGAADADAAGLDVIDLLAFNVALGGILSIAGGWIGRQAHESGPAARS